MYGDYGMGWGWGIFGAIHMVLLWGVLIVGIVVLVRWLMRGPASNAGDGANRALEILEERYARGEIDKAEFDAKRRDLRR